MVFAEYVNVLKKPFKHSISGNELCRILFDAIIERLDLKNRNGELLTVDKADISRIMNGKKKIPTALQGHVWDKLVIDGLEEYFKTIFRRILHIDAHVCPSFGSESLNSW